VSRETVKAASRAELMELPRVKEALDQAEAQLDAYRAVLSRSRGDTLKLRAFAVVALGFERLVARIGNGGSSPATGPKSAASQPHLSLLAAR
jgi:hypothetical protein